MENASKALIMAASVLIGMMIISLAIYLFVTFASSSAQMHEQIDENRLNEFNSQFTSYEEKDNLTIYDVVSVANLATENNKYYEFTTKNSIPTDDSKVSDYYVWVILGTNQQISYGTNTSVDYNNLISTDTSNINNNPNLKTYTCKVSISSITGRVYKVIFTEK